MAWLGQGELHSGLSWNTFGRTVYSSSPHQACRETWRRPQVMASTMDQTEAHWADWSHIPRDEGVVRCPLLWRNLRPVEHPALMAMELFAAECRLLWMLTQILQGHLGRMPNYSQVRDLLRTLCLPVSAHMLQRGTRMSWSCCKPGKKFVNFVPVLQCLWMRVKPMMRCPSAPKDSQEERGQGCRAGWCLKKEHRVTPCPGSCPLSRTQRGVARINLDCRLLLALGKDVCSPCHFLHAPAKRLGTVASCNNDAIEFGVLWRTSMRPSLL